MACIVQLVRISCCCAMWHICAMDGSCLALLPAAWAVVASPPLTAVVFPDCGYSIQDCGQCLLRRHPAGQGPVRHRLHPATCGHRQGQRPCHGQFEEGRLEECEGVFNQGRGFNKEPKDQHYYAMVIKATILKPELLNRCVNQWTLLVERIGRAGSAVLTK